MYTMTPYILGSGTRLLWREAGHMRKPFEELSHEDITFLKAVDQLVTDPDKYPHTSAGTTPANTRSLNELTELSKRQIRYRIKPYNSGENRGLDHMGYVKLYDAKDTESGYSPRAVELTDQGRKAVLTWEEKHGELEPDDWDQTTINEIELELEQMRSRLGDLEGIESRLTSIERSEYGAVDEDKAERLDHTIRLMISTHKVLTDVLGIPVEKIGDEMTVDDAREQIIDHLGINGTGSVPVESGPDEEPFDFEEGEERDSPREDPPSEPDSR